MNLFLRMVSRGEDLNTIWLEALVAMRGFVDDGVPGWTGVMRR